MHPVPPRLGAGPWQGEEGDVAEYGAHHLAPSLLPTWWGSPQLGVGVRDTQGLAAPQPGSAPAPFPLGLDEAPGRLLPPMGATKPQGGSCPPREFSAPPGVFWPSPGGILSPRSGLAPQGGFCPPRRTPAPQILPCPLRTPSSPHDPHLTPRGVASWEGVAIGA